MNILLPLITLLLCIITAATPALHAINMSFEPAHHVRLILFPLLAALVGSGGILLTALHAIQLARGRLSDAGQTAIHFCGLLCGTAVFAMVYPHTPAAAAATLRLIAPLLLASALLMKWMTSDMAERIAPLCFRSKWIIVQGILLTVFYTGYGITIASLWGEHSGDEGHYLCQAASLAEDGDLDVINNLGFEPHEQTVYMLKRKGQGDAAKGSPEYIKCRTRLREHMHISPNSKHGAWYSVHLPGLSLLLATGHHRGMPFRQTLLASLSGLTLMVLLMLCRREKVTDIWALFMTYALVLSSFWAVHSFRALPEILAALLVTTAVCFGITRGLTSMPAAIITAVALGFLPWAHSRFSIHALILSIFVVLREFYVRKMRISKPLMLFCTLMAVAGGVFVFDQFNRFEGGSPYDVGGVFMSYPIGALRIFFSRWSLLFAFPFAAILIPAGMIGSHQKLLRFTAGTLFAAVIITASCTIHWSGGSATPGRYFISVLPLFIPSAAALLARRSRSAQMTAVFLALLCVSATFICLFNLQQVGRDMLGNCFHQIRWALPSLHGLPYPFPPNRYDWAPFTLCLFGCSLIILIFRRIPFRAALIAVAATALAATAFSRHYEHLYSTPRRPTSTAVMTADFPLDKSAIYIGGYTDKEHPALLNLSNRFYWPAKLSAITSVQPPFEKNYKIYNVSDLGENGWEGNGYRWFTLTPPFSEKHGGLRIVGISGHCNGDIAIVYAVKKGAEVCITGSIPIQEDGTFGISRTIELSDNKADIYLLVRMEGSGTCYIDNYSWSPMGKGWQKSGLTDIPQ